MGTSPAQHLPPLLIVGPLFPLSQTRGLLSQKVLISLTGRGNPRPPQLQPRGAWKRKHNTCICPSPSSGAKGPGGPRLQSSGGQRVPLETTSWWLSLWGSRLMCQPGTGSRWPWFLRVQTRVLGCSSMGLSTSIWNPAFLCAPSSRAVSAEVSATVHACPCICHRAWAPRRSALPLVAPPNPGRGWGTADSPGWAPYLWT